MLRVFYVPWWVCVCLSCISSHYLPLRSVGVSKLGMYLRLKLGDWQMVWLRCVGRFLSGVEPIAVDSWFLEDFDQCSYARYFGVCLFPTFLIFLRCRIGNFVVACAGRSPALVYSGNTGRGGCITFYSLQSDSMGRFYCWTQGRGTGVLNIIEILLTCLLHGPYWSR